MTAKDTQSLIDWLNAELSKASSIYTHHLGARDEHLFEATVHLGYCCLALRHMREKASTLGATPAVWDITVERLFPKFPLDQINLYVSAGHILNWDMTLINEFQQLIPAEMINFNGTPVEPMREQLRRLGLVNPGLFEHWARTQENARQKAIREAEEEKAREERAIREKEAKARAERERIARDTKARYDAEVRRLEEEKVAREREAREAAERAQRIALAAQKAEEEAKAQAEEAEKTQATNSAKEAADARAEAKAAEAARVKAEAEEAEREAQATLEASQASAEEVIRAQEEAKAAQGLDPRYERILDKLIAMSQAFPKMEKLFEEIATVLDLLPHKKVEAFKRNLQCLVRVAAKLNLKV